MTLAAGKKDPVKNPCPLFVLGAKDQEVYKPDQHLACHVFGLQEWSVQDKPSESLVFCSKGNFK